MDYNNKLLRDENIKRLMIELKENQFLGEMDVKMLKFIKDVYRMELQKIEKAKSCCGTDEV